MIYKTRPKSGKGKKAWDKFVEMHHAEPLDVEYSYDYDGEYRGWVCNWDTKGNLMIHNGAGNTFTHDFYLSCEL